MAVRAYQRLGRHFLRLTVGPSLVVLTGYIFSVTFLLPGLFTTSDASRIEVQIREAITAFALLLVAGGPATLIGLSYAAAVVSQLTADLVAGSVPEPRTAEVAARRSLGAVFKLSVYELFVGCAGLIVSILLMASSGFIAEATPETSAWAGVVAAFGILGIIVGGFWFLWIVATHALAVPIVVVEGLSTRDAARRSRRLLGAMGRHPSGVGTIVLLYAAMLLLFLILQIGFGLFFEASGLLVWLSDALQPYAYGGPFVEAVQLLPTFFSIWTLTPFWAATVTLLYFERRVRTEGYDIEALAQEVWRAEVQARFEL